VADLTPQQRRRGLFHATVYDAKVNMQGSFFVPGEARLKEFVSDKTGHFLWDQAFLAFGTTTALSGLRTEDNVSIGGKDSAWQPCLEAIRYELDCKGAAMVVARLEGDAGTPLAGNVPFKSAISLRGTTSFNVLFGGKELDLAVRSSWPSPSFVGDALPATSNVGAEGFDASWQIAEFGSPRMSAAGLIAEPLMWQGAKVGVDLIEATPIYRMITRVAKYGLLFVILSFATYFFFEFLSRLRIHVVQYGLLGLSLSLFSLLLLSLAEPIGYTMGYVVSAALVLAQSSLYTAAVAKRATPALVFAGMLTTLFAFLYVLLGLETYSLLIGALALFAVVSVLMFVTQRIDWSALPLAGGAEAR
jgi:inner membrane protein